MTKFFNNSKKTILYVHFALILENLALSHTTLYRFLISCHNLEKTNDPIPKKHQDK